MRGLTELELAAVCGGVLSDAPENWPTSLDRLTDVRLTTRQAQCLAWVAAGKTTPAIAAILELSPASVDTYVAAACRRLGVQSRTEAACLAMKKALLQPPGDEAESRFRVGEIK
jgi:DNA-binding CsgD family transcriptional regulator